MSFVQNTACNRHFHWASMYFEFIGFTLNHDYGNVIICSRVIFFFLKDPSYDTSMVFSSNEKHSIYCRWVVKI